MSKALLLSGGIDSIAMAYWQRPDFAITINYGQAPADTEIRISKIVAEALNIEHHVVLVDCSSLGSGDLLNQSALEVSPSSEWWPYRNQLLITLACMKAIALGVQELMLASVRSDGFHKDGTSEFYRLTDQLMRYQEGGIKITCPAIDLSSVELVRKAKVPYSLLNWAHSCHRSNIPCGKCRGCNKYREVMYELQQTGNA
ncbi:7-cyano-7-deazaguanine synthase [Mucilaginibacter sp. 14171R-50]|jgi:7-cyano-7-deazaguanine synthase|uniref:7-cyano-7-deazaguanine synthase n=1 Tax=Mucilaginibacter sp. 14171R-50 TaxID=2703789 RepID=UPI00138C4423|nr:7-cyano-7-deazaguanine synthase [Mucilaginibacter sp. 14171R-50]QHS55226.1 7-cyano-7-deazaguanine synthase [Mucilaginibacter sp. 14171R-50]